MKHLTDTIRAALKLGGAATNAEIRQALTALSELERMAGEQEPILIVQHGEICYKSQDDDQSYGMWCPVTPDAEHGLRNGTQLYAAPVAQQPQLMVDMVPPATVRDRWMFEQGRLAERDPRTHAILCERICAAIKSADDKSVDEADYMLDSNDCIRIVREQFATTPPAQQPQYEAGDIASAAAQGFRDGVASVTGQDPAAWLVCSVNSDGSLSLEHATAWEEAAHEHINDAITEHGIEEAASWVVRPAYVAAPVAQHPQTEPDDETLKERDDAEDFIDMLLDEVLGTDRPEWTSAYGRDDALRDVQERMTALHKPTVDKAWDRFEKAQQPQARPDFTDEWTGYLKDGETPFERFLRERKDMQSVLKLYQRVLEENERLKAQQPQAEAVPITEVTLRDWKDRINTLASCSTRSDRVRLGSALKQDIADAIAAQQAQPSEPVCNPHPKAPHGFNRNGSHNAGRYVCDCGGWDAWDAGYSAGWQAGFDADAPEQAQAEAMHYTHADLDRAYSAGLVEGERLAIQQAEAVPIKPEQNLFELWWADHMPEATVNAAWDAWTSAVRYYDADKPKQAEAVPPGYVLVPVEPTKEMMHAAVQAVCYGPEGGFTRISGPQRTWKAMIDAAIAQQKGASHE